MKQRRSLGLFVVLGSTVACACGGGTAPSGAKFAEAIPSMAPYPATGAGETKVSAAPDGKAKTRDLKTVCAGAPNLDIQTSYQLDEKGTLVRRRSWALASKDPAVHERLAKSSYSLVELQTLEKKQAWDELLDHAEDVAPSQRGGAWEKLVERAAIEQIRGFTKSGAYESAWTAQALLKRYPHLTKSNEFMRERGEASKAAAEHCFHQSYRGQYCIDEMNAVLSAPSTAPELGFEFGKIVRRNQNHYVAAPFFKWAFDKKKADNKGSAAWCADEDLGLAMVAALGLPPDYEGAKAGRSIVAGVCFDALRPRVQKVLEGGEAGYFRDNACAVLKSKGAL